MQNLTIVMYHYVRPVAKSSYPLIKGLELDSFKTQLNYLEKNYKIITMESVINFIKNEKKIPSNSCLLTFDDGYKDHYLNVYPELLKRKIQGSFFPSAKPILEKMILDVNKIHFILAKQPKTQIIIEDIRDLINKEIKIDQVKLLSFDEYWNKHASANFLDTKEVVFIKRLLQFVLPINIRNKFCNFLFGRYVSKNQEEFSLELYMSENELSEMRNSNMYIGCHGYDHFWLNTISKEKQLNDIEKSLQFLKRIGASTDNWVMNYPFGMYNSDTIDILKKKNCCIGLTTKSAIADLKKDKLLELPRVDTNIFEKKINYF